MDLYSDTDDSFLDDSYLNTDDSSNQARDESPTSNFDVALSKKKKRHPFYIVEEPSEEENLEYEKRESSSEKEAAACSDAVSLKLSRSEEETGIESTNETISASQANLKRKAENGLGKRYVIDILRKTRSKLNSRVQPYKKAEKKEQEDALTGFGCPICLLDVTNKTFILDCYHQFCFKCVYKYVHSKYPECLCPLCKRSFTRIIYGFYSIQEKEALLISELSTKSGKLIEPDEVLSSLQGGSDTSTFKIISCKELFNIPSLKVITSLKELSLEVNQILKKTYRDRQIIYEYSLSPSFSDKVSKRLERELNQIPFTAFNQYESYISDSFSKSTDNGLFIFLRREVIAILNINQPLDIDNHSIVTFFTDSVLSILQKKPSKLTPTDSFQDLTSDIDSVLYPHGRKFLLEFLGFLLSPFFPSVEQFDKWIKYKSPS